MADIATLGIGVDATGAINTLDRYDAALEDVATSSDKVTRSTKQLDAATRAAISGTVSVERSTAAYANAQRLSTLEIDEAAIAWDQKYNPAARRAASASDRAAASVKQTSDAVAETGTATRRTTGGIGRLNNALITMTRRMFGANAAAGQLVDVLGTFAIGLGRMTAILAGLAAIGFAWQRITRESRAAKAELKDNLEFLDKLRESQTLAASGGQVAVSLRSAQEESRRIAAQLRENLARDTQLGTFFFERDMMERVRLTRELAESNQRVAAGLQDLAEGYDLATVSIDRMTAAAVRQREEIEGGLLDPIQSRIDNEANVQRDLEFIRTDIAIQQGNERRQIEEDALRAQILRGIELFEESEERKTEKASQEARARAQAEIEQQRRIRNIARGADILGGVIGGTVGGGLQGGAGGALTGLGISGGNPLGAIAGGAIGFVGGLFSAGRRAREAERLAQEAAKVAGETLAERRRLLREELNIRSLLVTGDSDAAELARLDARQRQERAAATNLSASDLELLGLIQELERDALIRRRQAERAIEVAQEQLDVLSDQLSEQERTVDTFRNVVANLGAFGESLSLGAFSPLSPSQRLAEARSQFEALRSLALSGDISAAESLPEASRRLLEASRAFNASGLGFVSDFNRVQDTVELVRSQFANQLSVEESIRDELILQRELLEAEILLHEQAIEDTNRQAADALAAWREIQERQEALDQEREDREAERRRLEKEGEAEEREADRQAIEELGRNINDGLGEVGSALNNLTGVVTEERDK